VYTDLATIHIRPEGLFAGDLSEGLSLKELERISGVRIGALEP
jgi:hypothetical protein